MISAAEIGNVQAIHPGYGFLAENAHFNEVCRSCKIDFIGPTPEAMARLGDKNAARKLAREAKVPVVPGSDGLIDERSRGGARSRTRSAFPVLIKAAAGGGGRGMRVALERPGAQGGAAAGPQPRPRRPSATASVYLEKYIEHPRHVEVQMLADHHGNVVHLWERDCTMQRRHQKLIEESPAPRLTPETRAAMCEAAVRLIKAAGYTNAGTVEFIVDQRGQLLLHRSQRPHPGRASGDGDGHRHRPDQGADSRRRRRAAAVRSRRTSCHAARRSSAASTPKTRKQNFQPSPGKIERLIVPGGFGVRFDSHAHGGYVVSPYYDSMIGKLIVHQPTRRRGDRVHAAGARRAADRRDQDHGAAAPGDPAATRRSSKAGSTRRSSNAADWHDRK